MSHITPRNRRLALNGLFFLAGLCFASWASRIPDLQTKFGLSEAALGGVLLVLPIGSLTALPLAGWSVHRFGSRPVILISAIAYAATLPLIALSPGYWMLFPVVFLFGMLGNMMNISLNTQALSVEKALGKSILASFHGLWSLAGFVGAGIGAFMVFFGLSPAVHYLIVMCLAGAIVFFTYPYLLNERSATGGGGLTWVKPDALLLRVGLIAFLGMLAEGCMFDWSGIYFKKVVEVPAAYTVLGYVFFMGAMATGRFLADPLIERKGRPFVLRFSGLLIAGGLFLSVGAPLPVAASIGFVLVGFGVAAIVPVCYGIAGRSASYPPSVSLALVSTISFFGFLLGPPLIGFIAELAGLRFSFFAVALAGLGIYGLSTWRTALFQVGPKVKSA
ncbi:MFS transporter [Nitritalea halalkaliphila]|nr:MFS transporter [Nitritalea halalkaliphila]